MGRVDEIAHDHFFLRATTAEMAALAADVAGRAPDGWFTAAHFRDRMDNGRKVAIQILDFFDRHGLTLRRGDLRRINPHRLDLFGTSEAPRGKRIVPGGASGLQIRVGQRACPGWVRTPILFRQRIDRGDADSARSAGRHLRLAHQVEPARRRRLPGLRGRRRARGTGSGLRAAEPAAPAGRGIARRRRLARQSAALPARAMPEAQSFASCASAPPAVRARGQNRHGRAHRPLPCQCPPNGATAARVPHATTTPGAPASTEPTTRASG